MSVFPTSFTGTSSFGSFHFWLVQSAGRSVPLRGKKTIYKRDPVPYSNDAVTQVSGTDRPPAKRSILLKSADWNGLLALVGTRATLACLGDASISALLVEVDEGQSYPDGYILTTLNFEY